MSYEVLLLMEEKLVLGSQWDMKNLNPCPFWIRPLIDMEQVAEGASLQ